MTREQEMAQRELRVFHDFRARSNLPIDPESVEKRDPPEPDILCRHRDEGLIAFELVELCDPRIASALGRRNSPDVCFFRTSDPSARILCNKLSKDYNTRHPIELVCYSADRIITPDDVIIPTIRPYIESNPGPFRRVWFMGESVGLIHDKAS